MVLVFISFIAYVLVKNKKLLVQDVVVGAIITAFIACTGGLPVTLEFLIAQMLEVLGIVVVMAIFMSLVLPKLFKSVLWEYKKENKEQSE